MILFRYVGPWSPWNCSYCTNKSIVPVLVLTRWCAAIYVQGVYEIMEQTKKQLFKSMGVDVTIAKASARVCMSVQSIPSEHSCFYL